MHFDFHHLLGGLRHLLILQVHGSCDRWRGPWLRQSIFRNYHVACGWIVGATLGATLSQTESDDRVLVAVPFYFVADDAEHVVLHSSEATLRLKSSVATQIAELLLPLLDGQNSIGEICHRLSGVLPAERTRSILERLITHSFVKKRTARPTSLDPNIAALLEPVRRFFDDNEDGGWDAVSELRNATVAVVNMGAMSVDLVESLVGVGIGQIRLFGQARVTQRDVVSIGALRGSDVGQNWHDVLRSRLPFNKYECALSWHDGVPTTPEAWSPLLDNLSMVAVALDGPTYFYDELLALNEATIGHKVPWLLMSSVQRFGLSVGPTFVPRATACFKCFEIRLKANLHDLRVPEVLEKYVRQGGQQVEFGSFGPRNRVAANLAAIEICNTLLAKRGARTSGRMLTLDLEGHELQLHHVLRLPRCPVCNPVSNRPRPRAWE